MSTMRSQKTGDYQLKSWIDVESNHTCDPNANIYVDIPVVHGNTSNSKLKWHNNYPRHHIIISHRKSPSWIDKANWVGIETSRDWIHNGELTKSVDNIENHEPNDAKA